MTPPCTANPRLWETHRLVEFNYVKAPRHEIQAAIDACATCPLLAACREWQPAVDMVQAGVIHNAIGKPVTLAEFCGLNVPGNACQELTGTLEGANRHRQVGESPCEPCRKESRRSKAGRRLTRCRRGHRYTTATTGLDSLGRRICFVCRPDRIPATQERAA